MNVDIIPYGTCHELVLNVYCMRMMRISVGYLEELEHCYIVYQNEYNKWGKMHLF